nr:protein fdrA [Raoultella sp. NCTC 9187]
MIYAFVKKGSFQDSVSLMLISRKLSAIDDVEEVSVMMGTPANKALLESTGFWHEEFAQATPNDICAAIRTRQPVADILNLIQQRLGRRAERYCPGAEQRPASAKGAPLGERLRETAGGKPGADLRRRGVRGGRGPSGAGER